MRYYIGYDLYNYTCYNEWKANSSKYTHDTETQATTLPSAVAELMAVSGG